MDPLQKLFDELLAGALDVMRLAGYERQKVLRWLLELEKELTALLATQELSQLKKNQFKKVLASADEIITAHYNEIAASLDIAGLSEYVAKDTSYAFQIALGLDSIGLPRQDYFQSLASDLLLKGAPVADWWRGQSQDTAFKFAAEVRQGLANDETNQQIIARIVGKSGEPGIMETAKRNAASLVQTSVQLVANDARRATFKANDDLVIGIKQVSTLDSHTSIVCVSYSGAEWNLDYEPINGYNLPFNGGTPRHFNCRSTEVPLLKSFRDLGIDLDEVSSTRASSMGQIADDTTFDGFLKRMGQDYQDEVLGVGRADLWRKGKITLRDLVSGTGRPLSLEELNELAKQRRAR